MVISKGMGSCDHKHLEEATEKPDATMHIPETALMELLPHSENLAGEGRISFSEEEASKLGFSPGPKPRVDPLGEAVLVRGV